MGNLTWTPLPSPRQLVQFYDPANPTNSYSPQNNPDQIIIKPNSARKYVETINATSVILGDREFPPKEISLSWSVLNDADLQGIRPFTGIAPVVYVDNNDQGYLGVFVLDEVQQLPGKTMLVHSVKASFLVLAPYNGQHTTLNNLTAPTLSPSWATIGGYIPASTTLNFWATVFTPYGESTVSPILTTTSGSGSSTNVLALSFTPPASSWYRKTRLYWSTGTDPTVSTLFAEILSGQTATFSVYGPFYNYSTVNPPSYSTAFTGYFSGGKWEQGT